MWDRLIQGFVLALIWLYEVLGSSEWSLVLSIAALTIAVRVLTLPLTLPSQRSMKKNARKMQELKPQVDQLKKKYKDQQTFLQKQQELYREHDINMLSSLSGCLPMLIQLPIIWAFYQSISRTMAYRPGEMLVLTQYLSAVPRFMSLVPLPSQWLWFNLARPDVIILPILVAGSTWLQQKLSTTTAQAAATDAQSAQMSQQMMIMMPLMFGYLAMQMPAGLSIYFIVSNVVGIGIQAVTNRYLNGDDEAEDKPVRRTPPSDGAGSGKDNRSGKRTSSYRKRGYRRRG